ncbi:uncharacterized protein LOC142236451 [Haematobia irritans]|uniref:uncharacterized protein LOC142236451 n=1 Tax=Haematobia irritans TaxID=7368 RepID=UPI003F4FAE90
MKTQGRQREENEREQKKLVQMISMMASFTERTTQKLCNTFIPPPATTTTTLSPIHPHIRMRRKKRIDGLMITVVTLVGGWLLPIGLGSWGYFTFIQDLHTLLADVWLDAISLYF